MESASVKVHDMPRKYTQEEYEQAQQLREKGLSYGQIEKTLQIKKDTIRSWTSRGHKPRSIWSDEENMRVFGHNRSQDAIENIRKAKLRSLNPMWKGDECTLDTARDRAKRWYGDECPEGYEIHHIDGNPWNNEHENIEFVKRRVHMVKDGRMEKLIETVKNKSEKTREKLRAASRNRIRPKDNITGRFISHG